MIFNKKDMDGFKKVLADQAVNKKLTNLRQSGSYDHCCCDGIVFKKTKSVLGGNCRFMRIFVNKIYSHWFSSD